jgi:hypothetical protein
MHERKLCSRPRTNEQSFDLFQCIVSILQVLITFSCGYVKCNILYKGESLRLIICGCYSLEMASNVGLGVSFDNV